MAVEPVKVRYQQYSLDGRRYKLLSAYRTPGSEEIDPGVFFHGDGSSGELARGMVTLTGMKKYMLRSDSVDLPANFA